MAVPESRATRDRLAVQGVASIRHGVCCAVGDLNLKTTYALNINIQQMSGVIFSQERKELVICLLGWGMR